MYVRYDIQCAACFTWLVVFVVQRTEIKAILFYFNLSNYFIYIYMLYSAVFCRICRRSRYFFTWWIPTAHGIPVFQNDRKWNVYVCPLRYHFIAANAFDHIIITWVICEMIARFFTYMIMHVRYIPQNTHCRVLYWLQYRSSWGLFIYLQGLHHWHKVQYIPRNMHTVLLCCALLWLYIDWFYHIHQAYFTGTVAI